MQVTTGAARGVRLAAPPGTATRPTADMVKQSVFNRLQFRIAGKRVLDLFAGSGQLGIEALSRGASSADSVDNSKEAVETIKRNAERTGLKVNVYRADFADFLRRTREGYDVIFLDPPYESGLLQQAFDIIAERGLLAPGGVIVAESSRGAEIAAKYPLTHVKRHGIKELRYYENRDIPG